MARHAQAPNEAQGNPELAALASVLVPGAGQFLVGRRERGLALLAGTVGIAVVIAWYGGGAWWLGLAPYWLAQIADAFLVAADRRAPIARLALLGMLPVYLVGWQAMEIAPERLVTNYERVRPLVRGLSSPQILDRSSESVSARVRTFTPCREEGETAPVPLDASAPSVALEPGCAPLGATVTALGAGFPADAQVALDWIGPTGDRIHLGPVAADASGAFAAEITIPLESIPARLRESIPDQPQRQHLEASAVVSTGGMVLHDTMRLILANIGVTIALGFLATVFGALLAVPLAVLGARNLMTGHAIARPIYIAARLLMNVMRSIEPLIIAVIFVVWVGQGPFAGMLALTLHTIAALGKLFSEAIESIDPGPVEAMRASGANWLQQIAYGVLPQVLPPFTAFTVYRWDINVRMSTIIGFVGGGGIGFLLQQWIFKTKWSEAATAVLVIAVVLIVLDQFSSTVRERITAGHTVVPAQLRPLALLALVAFTAWAWRTTTVDLVRLVRDADKVAPILGQIVRPALFDKASVEERVALTFNAPCDGATSESTVASGSEGITLSLSRACGEAGEQVTVSASGLAGDASARLRWLLPGERRLDAARVAVVDGAFETDVEIRPIVAAAGESVQLELEIARPVGGWRVSEPLRRTLERLVETILMALMAATLGALLAMPLAFLGARNLMPRSLLGNAAYYGSRTFMNVARAIEPLILAAVFAAWVGYGAPFAGVLALVIVTMANLGKLFSEAVENIDPGPMEALQASGASRAQVIRYGVVPQIVPPFLAFGIYFWDIDVRMSTILGFVGAGGIGFVLNEWMRLTQWSWAAVAILGIVIVVTVMDTLSARVREQLV